MSSSKEYRDYVVSCLSEAGPIKTRAMMGEFCVYFRDKLIGSICDNRLLLKQTESSKKLLAECKLEYPYEGSKTLMLVVDCFEDIERMKCVLPGMYEEL